MCVLLVVEASASSPVVGQVVHCGLSAALSALVPRDPNGAPARRSGRWEGLV